MRRFPQKAVLLWLGVGMCVVTLAGCNGGSPPTNVLLQVAGQVLLLKTDGSTEGQANVTVVLTSQTRADQYQAATGAGGQFAIPDVIAPDTYAVAIQPPAGVTGNPLNDLAIPVADPNVPFQLPAIYVAPTAPGEPAL